MVVVGSLGGSNGKDPALASRFLRCIRNMTPSEDLMEISPVSTAGVVGLEFERKDEEVEDCCSTYSVGVNSNPLGKPVRPFGKVESEVNVFQVI